jgi:hypothetical protein
VFYIELLKGQHPGWMHRYQDLLPIVAAIVNQGIFLEMMYKAIISPHAIEGSWERQPKKLKV